MSEYDRLLKNPKPAPEVPYKPLRPNLLTAEGKALVGICRSNGRRQGIKESLRLIGGLERLVDGVYGEIVIKPNCNCDYAFPRDTHPETVMQIAESLIETGFPSERIVVGDMSGRYRGLPTRQTMANMGFVEMAEKLGIRLSYFEEEEWVTVRPPLARNWPIGIRIPRRVYEADRVILTPVMRCHSDSVFTMSLKLGVGLIDAGGREWLHNGESFFEKLVELNLAFSADLVVTDASSFFVDRSPIHKKSVRSDVFVASGSRVAADAVGVAIMKEYGAYGMVDNSVLEQRQITIAEELGLGEASTDRLLLKTAGPDLDPLVLEIAKDLSRNIKDRGLKSHNV